MTSAQWPMTFYPGNRNNKQQPIDPVSKASDHCPMTVYTWPVPHFIYRISIPIKTWPPWPMTTEI